MHPTGRALLSLTAHGAPRPASRPLLGAARGARPAGARGRARSRAAAAVVAASFALAACSGGAASDVPAPTPSAVSPTASAAQPAAPVVVPDIPVTSAIGVPDAAAPAPATLTIKDLDISMAVDAVGVEPDGTMTVPEDGDRAGWYRYGPAPADSAGAVVVAAHVDTLAGLGQFSRLVDIDEGARVIVTDDDGQIFTYTVTDIERIAKSDVPLEQVFDRAGDRRLTLVTCGGRFDRSTGHYVDNVIVTAVPAP
ncbi:class F sortase [Sanguibacter hominis ATCC BAA-789]|uniref:Class F sortase n=1 Tax=Sanguibacter hominis ATCC BAA-789 TaxID=1312740 RepID=A0A9X5IRW5_9MICO|nr:class F sortase [Sanguibacter hominis]NKX92421.1 class F sortase [Sanguibacter hominis ATCC BAA-789]